MALSSKDLYKGKPNPFDDASKGAAELLKLSDELILNFKELSKVSKNAILTNQKKDTSDFKRLAEDQSKLNQANKAASQIIKEKNTLELKLKKLNSDKIQQNEQLKVQVAAQRKNNKELARDQLKLIGSYEKLTKKTNEAQRKFKNLATTFGENSKQAKSAKIEFEKLDNKLTKVNKAARDGRRDVGQYSKGWQGLKKLFVGGLGILGVTAGFSAIRSGITKLVSTFSEFGKQVSKVAAISGASEDELKALTEQAQALGEATEKTASEVAQLQLELAKLGFDPKQIQNATDSILDLSTAIDADLAQSAKVVGSSLRAFGLEAEETVRVTDVMAAAFSKSSLDINKFQTAMASVAPVAKKFGFSIEDTTSLLAQLTDAGFDASSAGTATRKILLNLADSSGDLAKALGSPVDSLDDLLQGLTKLNSEGTDLGAALELTDVRSVAAFATFLEGVDSTRKLAGELEDAGGAASRMATIMRDNLSGDTDKAKSAMQGLFINIGKRLNPAMRTLTQRFTGFVGKLNEFAKIKASDELRKEKVELNSLVDAITNANNTQDSRNRLLTELQDKYPDFLENIDKETVSNEELRDALIDVNAEYEKKINQLAKQELITRNQEELTDLLIEEVDLIKKVTKAEKDFEAAKAATATGTESSIQAFTLASDKLVSYSNKLDNNRKSQKKLKDELEENLKILSELQGVNNDVVVSTEKVTKSTENATDAVIDYGDEIKKIQSIASKGITIKLGTEFPDLRTDNEKYIDDLVNRNAQAAIEANNELIAAAEERNNTIENIEKEHYDSLLGIFFNFKRKKIAADESLSKEERDIQLASAEREEAAYQQLADTLTNIGNQLLNSQLNNIQSKIDADNQAINEQEQKLNRELELLKAGAANEYETEKAKLERLQAARDKDLEEKRKIQKQQETINTLSQVSELATAVAMIISSAVSQEGWVGVVTGLAAAAAAIVGFSTYKSDAEAAVAEDGGTFTSKGAYIEKGNRHSQGGNRYNALETEKDEMHGILSRDVTKKHGDFYQYITDGLNDGLSPDELEMYNYSLNSLSPNNIIINNNNTELLNEMRNVSKAIKNSRTPLFDHLGNFRVYDNSGQLKSSEMRIKK